MIVKPANTCKACLRRMLRAQLPVQTPLAARSLSTSTFPSLFSSSQYSTLLPPTPVLASFYLSHRAASTASASPRSALPESLSDLINAKGSSERPPIHVTPPSLDAIKEEGYLDDDVQLIPPEEATLLITPEAIAQLERITSKEPKEVLDKGQLALRVGVESGGCHGYQYTMEIVEERGVDDYVMQPEGVKCIPVVVDLVSLGLLKGATLHHATELIGSSFRLQDNPQAKEGGNCGCGVSWELK